MFQCTTKKILPILLAAGILSFPALAGLARLPEPASGYSGTSYYQGARLDYAVYDTTLTADALALDAPGEGRYIYAYQVFNVSYSSSAIGFLSLYGIEEGAITSIENVGSVEDDGGIEPTDNTLNSTKTIATYEFANGDLVVGENSWFLTIRSDGKPKAGTFTLSAPTDDDAVVPDDDSSEVPEPATLGMLLLGAVSMLRRCRR